MRALLLIVAIAPAIAGDMTCALDGSAAGTDALQAGVFAWAATNRCGKADGKNGQIRCAVDVTAALASVNSMINTILGAANDCGALHTANPECGLAVGAFTAAVTGFSSKVTADISDCNKPKLETEGAPQNTDLGKCIIDLSGSVGAIFGSAHAFKNAKEDGCDDQATCAGNVLNVMSGIGNLGSAISASASDCKAAHAPKGTPPAAKGNAEAKCDADYLGTIAALSDIGAAAAGLSTSCAVSASRLYEVERSQVTSSGPSKAVLIAALPIFAVVSLIVGFVGGSRFTKYRSENTATDMENPRSVHHMLISAEE